MKLNRFGINVDEGIALATVEEFDRLFVDMESDALTRLKSWLKTDERPVLFGGQIGCGKTTLIEYAFYQSEIKPDIEFHFDSGSLNLSAIDSWSIIFVALFRYAASFDLIDIDEIPSDFKAILGDSPGQWQESLDMIRLQSFSESALEKNKACNAILSTMQDNLGPFFDSLIKEFARLKKSPLFLFASGVDKFQPGTAAYYALIETLPSLCAYKTLFEVNAVHLFSGDSWIRNVEKIFISAAGDKQIEGMLAKRLGRYAEAYVREIPLLAKHSGGIPRQALRLLDSFLAEQKRKVDNREAFFNAVEDVNRDFFAFSRQPEQPIMQLVNKDRFLETGWISLPGDMETAQTAVFGNWIIQTS